MNWKNNLAFLAILSLIIFNNCNGMDEWYNPENHFSGKELLVAQAIKNNDKKEIRNLIKKYGIDVNATGKTGYNFLLYSVDIEKKKSMEELLELGANPNMPCTILEHPHFRNQYRPSDVYYPIYMATYYSDLSYLKTLLKYKANPNVHATVEQTSPMQNTIVNGQTDKKIEILELLLDYGADINIQDAFKNTPLHTAIMTVGFGNSYEIFLYLLNKGANPNIPDKYGETPAYKLQEDIQSYHKDGYKVPRLESLVDTLKARGVKFPVEKQKPNVPLSP